MCQKRLRAICKRYSNGYLESTNDKTMPMEQNKLSIEMNQSIKKFEELTSDNNLKLDHFTKQQKDRYVEI